MMILDTNVISEILRTEPSGVVLTWLKMQEWTAMYVTTVTQAELRFGIALMPEGRRRQGLARAVDDVLAQDFRGRILPFGGEAAEQYALIASARRAAGRPIEVLDCQIAAVARAAGAAVATRNVKDFVGCGVEVINPWQAS